MPDRVTLDDARRIARLARLGLSETQLRDLTVDLDAILGHMEALARVDTSGVPEFAADAEMPLRPDRGPPSPLARRPETFAPLMRDGFFLVPRVGTHEDAEP